MDNLRDQIPTQSKNFVVERFDNEILLYSLQSGTGYHLNETAYLVWEMCNEDQSVGTMITKLEAAYGDVASTIESDVISTIESFLDNGIVTLKP